MESCSYIGEIVQICIEHDPALLKHGLSSRKIEKESSFIKLESISGDNASIVLKIFLALECTSTNSACDYLEASF